MIENYKIIKSTYLDLLNSINNESIDLVCTDPAYSSLTKHRNVGTTTRLKSSGWFETIPNEAFADLFIQFYRVLKKNSHLYMFCDAETMFAIKPMGEAAGFKFWKPLVWDKKAIGLGYHYRNRGEFILFFEKGKRKLNDLGIPDIIECKRIRSDYPTEKPVAISEVLIKQSSVHGDIILDPFMGSGSIGEAALKNNRKFIGCDISDISLMVSQERLEKYAIQMPVLQDNLLNEMA